MAVVTHVTSNLAPGAADIVLPSTTSARLLAGWKWSSTAKPITGGQGILIVRLRTRNSGGVLVEFDGSVKGTSVNTSAPPVAEAVPITPQAIPIPAGAWVEIFNDPTSPGPIYAYVTLWT